MVMMDRWREQRRVCGVVGVFEADGSCGWWVIEVYKGFPKCVDWGHHRFANFRLGSLDISCRGAWECAA